MNGLRAIGAYAYFFGDCVRSMLKHGVPWDRLIDESYKLGIRSFPVLFTMALFVGSNLAIQGYAAFSSLGAGNLVGMFVALAGVREVCPLLAAWRQKGCDFRHRFILPEICCVDERLQLHGESVANKFLQPKRSTKNPRAGVKWCP